MSISAEKPVIAIFGGGGGTTTTARAIQEYQRNPDYYNEQYAAMWEEVGLEPAAYRLLLDAEIEANVGMADSGGYTKFLMDCTGELALGDIRNVIGGLSASSEAGKLFGKRFRAADSQLDVEQRKQDIMKALERDHRGYDRTEAEIAFDVACGMAARLPNRYDENGKPVNPLAGGNIGNLMLYGLTVSARNAGDRDPIITATDMASRVMGVQHARINPVTTARHSLEMNDDGKIIKGEHDIDVHPVAHDGQAYAYLVDENGQQRPIPAHPRAVASARNAARIVAAPGSPYTSMVPAMSLPEIQAAFREQKRRGGLFVAVPNLIARQQDTAQWCAGRYLAHVWDASDRRPDIAVFNTNFTDMDIPEGDTAVRLRTPFMRSLGVHAVGADLVGEPPVRDENDHLKNRSDAAHSVFLGGLLLSDLPNAPLYRELARA